MTLSEKIRFSISAISRYLPRIILYLQLMDSSLWHLHVTIFVALNSDKQKSIFTFLEVVKFPLLISHLVSDISLDLSFEVNLTITIVELILLSNIIRKFLKLDLLIQVFIQHCKIGE